MPLPVAIIGRAAPVYNLSASPTPGIRLATPNPISPRVFKVYPATPFQSLSLIFSHARVA